MSTDVPSGLFAAGCVLLAMLAYGFGLLALERLTKQFKKRKTKRKTR